jgi:DNA polymerase-3 subunit delta'
LSFSDILGHARPLAVIRQNILTGQLPPAYLFHGEEGIGKHLAATELAKAVNCVGEHEPDDSCGQCVSCRNIAAGCHPNVKDMALEVNPDTGKMRQEIVINQVRAAQEFLSLRAVGPGRKALIVNDAHLMNEEAMNALLKTLEEPPDNSHVVLVTSKPDRLLPTILSRCRAVPFQPLKEELVAGLLADLKGMPPADAAFVARMTGGRVGEALEADAKDLAGRRKSCVKLLDLLAGKGSAVVLKEAESAAKKEGGLEDIVFFGSMWFRDVMVILLGGGAALAYNRDAMDELSAWAGRLTPYRCEEALTLLKQAGRELERTFNRRLLAEDLFFRLKEEALS